MANAPFTLEYMYPGYLYRTLGSRWVVCTLYLLNNKTHSTTRAGEMGVAAQG